MCGAASDGGLFVYNILLGLYASLPIVKEAIYPDEFVHAHNENPCLVTIASDVIMRMRIG